MQTHDLSKNATHMVKDVLRLLRPHSLVGARKVRVGRFFDGGYVMLDRFTDVGVAYSLGINDDVSWDLDMAAHGISIFQYDHTIDGPPEQHPLFHWEPVCISGGVDDAAGRQTLEALIKRNGHEGRTDMILKCDIEGAEWELLRVTPVSILRGFRQIVIELHNMAFLTDVHHGNNVRLALLNLTATHRVVHVHANNFAPYEIVGGVPVPAVLELTLARIDEGEFCLSSENFPTSIDMPCHSEAADFYLGSFNFD